MLAFCCAVCQKRFQPGDEITLIVAPGSKLGFYVRDGADTVPAAPAHWDCIATEAMQREEQQRRTGRAAE